MRTKIYSPPPADPEELITVEEAARILTIAPKTVYNHNGGTEHLKRIYVGGCVRLLKVEVLGLRTQLIEEAHVRYERIYSAPAKTPVREDRTSRQPFEKPNPFRRHS